MFFMKAQFEQNNILLYYFGVFYDIGLIYLVCEVSHGLCSEGYLERDFDLISVFVDVSFTFLNISKLYIMRFSCIQLMEMFKWW